MARRPPEPEPVTLPTWDDVPHVERYVRDGRAYAVTADGEHVEVDRSRPYTGRSRVTEPSPAERLVLDLDAALEAGTVAPELRGALSREAATVRGRYVTR